MLPFEERAKKNKDLDRWTWDETSQEKWKKARSDVQEFYNRWHDSPSELGSEVDIGLISGIARMPEQFIVREAYKTMFDDIWKRAFDEPDTGIVVTGQPGIGKTYFLWYALIRLIQEHQPVALATGDFVYLFYNNRVWVTLTGDVFFPFGIPVKNSKERPPFVFVLIDHDISTSEPIARLHNGRGVFPIQASSPNPNRFKTWAKVRRAALWGLPLWNEAELNKALHLQAQSEGFKKSLEPLLGCSERSEDLEPELCAALDVLDEWKRKKTDLLQELKVDKGSTEGAPEVEELGDEIFKVDMMTIDGALMVLVHAAVRDFGPIARDVFEAIFSPEKACPNRKDAIATVTYEHLVELTRTFVERTVFPNQTISHRIVAVSPGAPSGGKFAYRRPTDTWTINYRCVRLAREMNKQLETKDLQRILEFFRLFRSYAQSSTMASWILEPIANRKLCTSGRQKLVLFEMSGDLSVDAPVLNVNFEKDVPVRHVDFEKDIPKGYPQLPGGDRKLVTFYPKAFDGLQDDAYYIPETKNFPLFDSFLVEARGAETRAMELMLWVFQTSTSGSHGGSREGYESIRQILTSLKRSFGNFSCFGKVTTDSDGKKIKKQKQEVKIRVNYVYVTPQEKEYSKYQWRCPSGWNENVGASDHRGKFMRCECQFPWGKGREVQITNFINLFKIQNSILCPIIHSKFQNSVQYSTLSIELINKSPYIIQSPYDLGRLEVVHTNSFKD